MAIIFISKNPEKYGFDVKPEKSLEWEIKKIKKSVKLDDIARCSKISKSILLQYNPEILREYIYVSKNKYYDHRRANSLKKTIYKYINRISFLA